MRDQPKKNPINPGNSKSYLNATWPMIKISLINSSSLIVTLLSLTLSSETHVHAIKNSIYLECSLQMISKY